MPVTPQPRPDVNDSPSPAAVRAELRDGLYDLSNAILTGSGSREELNGATHRLWVTTQLAELDAERATLVHDLLLEIAETLAKPEDLDGDALARAVARAADRL